MITGEVVWRVLEAVKDPEIPVVSLVDLGMVRSVGIDQEQVIVVLTPTFAGCPAVRMMQDEIESRLAEAGAKQVVVRLSHSPSWTSDWITTTGRAALQAFGLAAPPIHHGRVEAALSLPVHCPYCGSQDTQRTNDFGPTLCRAIHVCRSCRQPFEAFKPI